MLSNVARALRRGADIHRKLSEYVWEGKKGEMEGRRREKGIKGLSI